MSTIYASRHALVIRSYSRSMRTKGHLLGIYLFRGLHVLAAVLLAVLLRTGLRASGMHRKVVLQSVLNWKVANPTLKLEKSSMCQ